jgi:hypothetical protein
VSLIIQGLINRFLVDPANIDLTKLRLYNVEWLDGIWISKGKLCKKQQLWTNLNDYVDISVGVEGDGDSSDSTDRLWAKS